MKAKFNYIIFLIFVFIFCIVLTGCITDKKDSDLVDIETYSLVSSPGRLVFKKNDSYEVYYIKDNIVQKIEKVKAFSSNYYANEYYSKQDALMYKSIKCIDTLVIFEMNDEYLNENKYLTETDLIYIMEEAGFKEVNKD